MKIGEDTIEGVRWQVEVSLGKVSLLLDAWTSSNQYTFLAIVMRYVNKDWQYGFMIYCSCISDCLNFWLTFMS